MIRRSPRIGARIATVLFRNYHVLAIESSCDDSAVCLIERTKDGRNRLVDHKKRTLNSAEVGGIIPSDALVHHLQNIAPLVREIMHENKLEKADMVCATRGPGMYASLSAGLNVAKGLAVAWNVPFVGVHHMLGHLLTPRFFSNGETPQFPFLSLLASGGHTMLVLSSSVVEHRVLANTLDIAIGDSLDKCAREIKLKGNVLGKELEVAAEEYLMKESSREFIIPQEKVEELQAIKFPKPLRNSSKRSNEVAFSFAGFITSVKTVLAKYPISNRDTQLILANSIQKAIMGHLVEKVRLACEVNSIKDMDFVLAGGVAANSALRNMLSDNLKSYDLNFHFPEVKWCTDNALMIGWAGVELYESAHLETDISVMPVAKWPLAEILDVDSWKPRSTPIG